LNIVDLIAEAITLNPKSMRDAVTTGEITAASSQQVGVIHSDTKAVKKSGVKQWRLYAEHSWAVRTALDIHRNFTTLVVPAVVPVDPKKPMDEKVKTAIEDLFSKRMSNGDSYAEVKEQMVEDYFVLSHGFAELWLQRDAKPYNITPLNAANIGFLSNWDGTRLDSPRYAEFDSSTSRVKRYLGDQHVMNITNRKRSYDKLGLSHVEVLDMAVQGLLAGDDHLLHELRYPSASGALSLGEGTTPATADEVRAKIAAAAKWAFVVISGSKDPKFIPFKPKDLKQLDKQLWFVREVCALFGLPITALAQSADSTRANTVALLDQMGEGLKDTIVRIRKMENQYIVPTYGDPKKHNCRIDYPILNQKDALKQAELTAIQMAKQPYITINEARRDAGKEPLDLKIADDVLLNSSVGLVPLTVLNNQVYNNPGGEEPNKPNPDSETVPDEEDDGKSAKKH